MNRMNRFYIKTNRIFTPIRKYAWIFTLTVAIGGLWFPKLGLMVIPVIFALTGISFFRGRYWCGNFCPHGSLFDSLLNPLSRNKRIPAFFKSKIFTGAFFAFFTINLIRKIVKVIGIYGTFSFWDKLGFIFVASYLMVTVVGGLLSVLISQRTWCNFCPMGVMQMLSYKLGKSLHVNKKTDKKVTVARAEMCHACGLCSRVCPMQLKPYLEYSDKNQFDSEKCIRCSTCVENCPAGILSLDNEETAITIYEETNMEGYENRIKIRSKITKIKNISDDVKEISFKFIGPDIVQYKAGQFILVKVQDDPKMYRAYSISSYSEDGSGLSVTIKKFPDGYGTDIIFNEFKVGDEIELEGPMGAELIVDKTAEKVIFVAGGIGITPFVSMVQDVVNSENDINEMKLIYGVNKESEFMYDDHFKDMETQSDKFEYLKVVAFDDNWNGEKGFVTDVLKKMDLDGYKVYICGPKPMIKPTLYQLHKLGVDDEKLFYESA